MTGSTGLEPLLEAEHAAIYGYGIAGAALVRAQASLDILGAVRGGFDAHRGTRDQLVDVIAAAGGSPPVAEAAYQLPFDVTDAASSLRLLTVLEDRVSAVAAYAVSQSDGAARAAATYELSASAVRATRLRRLLGTPTGNLTTAFPGLPAG
jgi:hypothetical protein